MKDNWINHNTDKLMLFILLLLAGWLVMHIVHHDPGDMQAMTWAEGAFSTILGALILILTGRINGAHPLQPDNQSTSLAPIAQPPLPSLPSSSSQSQPPSPPPPSLLDQSGKLKVNVP